MGISLGKSVVAATDTAGSAILALQGAATGVAAGLDLYGVLVLAYITALGGGVVRDILLGVTPPAAFRSWRYVVIVITACVVITLVDGAKLLPGTVGVRLLGAVGLGLFTVAGTEKALDYGCRSFAAVMIGTISATGGGMVRDVLLRQVPVVMRADFYATAVMIGAILIVLLRRAGASRTVAGLVGGLSCMALRMAAVLLSWHLPSFN